MATPSLRDFPIFSTLSDDEHQQLALVALERTCKRGEFIYRDGEDARHVYLMVAGEVKTATSSADGRELIRSIIRPQTIFGQLALSGQTRRDGFAQSLSSETVLLQIPAPVIQNMMRQNFGLCQLLLQNVGQQLEATQHRLTSVVMDDARTRIIDFLRDAVHASGRKIGVEHLVRHCLTHQDIANLTCTSRQTVTLVLNELRRSNLIYFNRGKILVRDMAQLA